MSSRNPRRPRKRRSPLQPPQVKPTDSPLELDAASAARRARRERRLVGSPAVCALCGEADLDVLVHRGRTILHDHHVSGRQHEPNVELVLCLRCHAKEHERMRNNGVLLQAQPTTVDALVSVHRSRAVTFRSLAEAEARWAERLERVRLVLDRLSPEWRAELRRSEGRNV